MMDFVSSADRIITHGDSVVQTELCRLCNKIKRDKAMNKIQNNKTLFIKLDNDPVNLIVLDPEDHFGFH